MKKTFKFFMAVAFATVTLGFASCSKTEDLIIGSWELQSETYTQTISGFSGEYAEYNGTHTETMTPSDGQSNVVTFNNDGTVTIVTTYQNESETDNGTYTVSDDQLTMTINNISQVYDITEINKSELVISTTVSRTESFDDQTGTITATTVINFKKI